jgi:hypothetical protein
MPFLDKKQDCYKYPYMVTHSHSKTTAGQKGRKGQNMNKIRRKELANIVTMLEELDSLREQIRERLADVLDEEQEALDNLPESLQESERGEQMQEYIDAMENVTGELDLLDIEDLADQLRDICD